MKEIMLWKDPEKGIVDPTLFNETALEYATLFSREKSDKGKELNKRSQLRKFYDEVQNLDQKAQKSPDDWSFIIPQVYMLVPKAAYAFGREHVSKNFKDLIQNTVTKINKREDLHVFATFFEALMGFYREFKSN